MAACHREEAFVQFCDEADGRSQLQDTAAAELRCGRMRCTSEGHIADPCGFAYLRTYSSYSSVTAALLELKIAYAVETGGYDLQLNFGCREQSITFNEAAARAAAAILSEELDQKFFMKSRLD
jgi:hypothetical protein